MSLVVETIQFTDSGLVVQYIELPGDARVEGKLMKTHSLMISAAHPDYREDIQELERHAKRVLKNCLEDFEDSEPFEPDVDPDGLDPNDDDAPVVGMGDR